MTAYFGQIILLLALTLGGFAFLGKEKKLQLLHLSQTILLVFSFFWLVIAYLRSDFTLLNVFLNSHTQKPWLYKLTGAWGNHEGSMLLWVMLQACVGYFFARSLVTTHEFKRKLHLLLLCLNTGFILFLIFACDPFAISAETLSQGRDLNPLLQDPLLAIHPPCLYIGYVSTSLPFLVMLAGGTEAGLINWRQVMQPWLIFAWVFLTAGLALGSFWAYYELGWGGWWFWDPVENAALVPWLLLTALMHFTKLPPSIIQNNNRAFNALITATYSSCLFGTYLVRSGALTSVHSFAVDPERGIMLLILCTLILIPGIIVIGRSHTPSQTQTKSLLITSWGGLMGVGITLLVLIAGIILFGTVYPLFLNMISNPLTVGASFYQSTVIPMAQPIILLMAITPWVMTKTPDKHLLVTSGLLAAFSIITIWVLEYQTNILQAIILFFALFLLYSTLILGISTPKPSSSKLRMLLAHTGLVISILGMVLSTTLESEKLVALSPGEVLEFSGQRIRFIGVNEVDGPNYAAQQATLMLNEKHELKPQKRFYWTQGIIHGETSIHSSLLDHLYVALGDEYQTGQWSIRIYYKPYINLLWMGALLMVLSGIICWPWRVKKISS